jgi:molybdopterin-guanine dinucleotide biosynthesis protein MobB
MPPIISIVGESKSGKTTLIEKLISELKSRGHRVATIKHSIHPLDFDKAGKDSWRHIQAGSAVTAIVSKDQVVLIKPVSREPDLKEIAGLLGDGCDIILTDGFKYSNAPKIEVHRKVAGPPLNGLEQVIATATDETLSDRTRQFSLNDIKGLADLLESHYIKSK